MAKNIKPNAKLNLDIQTGKLEVQGSEKFVREIYTDFKSLLEVSNKTAVAYQAKGKAAASNKQSSTEKSDTTPNRTKKAKGSSNPTVDTNLDTLGLKDFFANYKPKTDPHRALIFAKYLESDHSKNIFTLNELYSCFFALKSQLKIPNIDSLLVNDQSRTKFFQKNGIDNISITTIGENFFNLDMPKADED